jgi:type I restriction enzyme, S subunit
MSVEPDAYYPLNLSTLPPSWVTEWLGDVAVEVQPGFASGAHNEEGEGVPHLRMMNVTREGNLDLARLKYVETPKKIRIRRGEVLFTNTNSYELVGKTAAFLRNGDWALSNHMTRIRLPDDFSPQFVARQLHLLWMLGYFRHRCTRYVNQASFGSRTLGSTVPLIVAPLNEQRRIVDALETELTRLDTAVAALGRVRATLSRYRASLLASAFRGEVVPSEHELAKTHGQAYESGEELVARILKERLSSSEMKTSRKTRNGGGMFQSSSGSRLLPAGWVWSPFGNVATVESDLVDPREYRNSPHVAPDNIEGWTGRLLPCRTIEEDGITSANHRFRQGMIIYSKIRPYLAKATVAPFDGLCSADMYPVSTPLVSRFLLYWMLTTEFVHHATARQGRSLLPKINQEELTSLPVPVPPLVEQDRIVTEVERRFSLADEVQVELGTGLMRCVHLRQSILKTAFEGRLVPQDLSDETAKALMERIKRQRSETCAPTSRERRFADVA